MLYSRRVGGRVLRNLFVDAGMSVYGVRDEAFVTEGHATTYQVGVHKPDGIQHVSRKDEMLGVGTERSGPGHR